MEQVHSAFRCNRPFDPRWHDKDVANIYVMSLTIEHDRTRSVKDLKDRRANIAARQRFCPSTQTVKLTSDGGITSPPVVGFETAVQRARDDRGRVTFILKRKLFA